MRYIVDSCVWIDFMSGKKHFDAMTALLNDNLAFTNKIILAELLPSAKIRKENDFIECISGIEIVPLEIDWDEITEMQFNCLKSGINKIGLLDIVILQNVKQNKMGIFSTDKHIIALANLLNVQLL